MKIRVLTFNMHKGYSPLRMKYTLKELRECLAELHPDIVFLQEITGQHPQRFHADHGGNSPLEVLADTLWDYKAYGKNAIYTGGGHHGNAILSKFPFEKWENIDISTNRWERRGLLHGEVTIDSDFPSVHLFCLHLDLLESGRRKQIDQTIERLRTSTDDNHPVILGGDFNDWRQRVDFGLHHDLRLKEAFEEKTGFHAKTFPSFRPALALDRVYYRGFRLHSVEVVQTSKWRGLSDHLPLLVELEIKR